MANTTIEVSSNLETNIQTERLIHMSRYLDFLKLVQEFEDITNANHVFDMDAVSELITNI